MDKIFSITLPIFVPLSKVASLDPPSQKKFLKTKEKTNLNRIRIAVDKWLPGKTKLWNKIIRNINKTDYLIMGTAKVPRNENLLLEEGASKEIMMSLFSQTPPKDTGPTVDIAITCPRSALLSLKDATSYKNTTFESCNLDQLEFVKDAKILINFFGGGFVMGSPQDHIIFDFIKELYSTNDTRTASKTTEKKSPIILLSVNYRLAPENPFPAAIIDALSATTYILEKFSSANYDVHMLGVSSGGNLALVSALEYLRRNTNKINKPLKSLVIVGPFLEPKVNSKSYQLNTKYNAMSLPMYLRWCWSAYLQLEEDNNNETKRSSINYDSISEYSKALHEKLSPVMDNHPEIMRLISPLTDIPPSSSVSSELKIIVTTSTADSLRDEGNQLVEILKEQNYTNVLHFEGKGSHTISHKFDTQMKNKFFQAWASTIWK